MYSMRYISGFVKRPFYNPQDFSVKETGSVKGLDILNDSTVYLTLIIHTVLLGITIY